MTILTHLRSAARKRLAYLRTRKELQTMPIDVALDLDIDRNAASAIAHRAVYGG